jgi:serine/threonine protein kinase
MHTHANTCILPRQVCKISDFGLSRIKNESVTKISGMLGTPGWSAPEIYKQDKYTEKVDMYSFGVVLRCVCVYVHVYIIYMYTHTVMYMRTEKVRVRSFRVVLKHARVHAGTSFTYSENSNSDSKEAVHDIHIYICVDLYQMHTANICVCVCAYAYIFANAVNWVCSAKPCAL